MPLIILFVVCFLAYPFITDLYEEGQIANQELCKEPTHSLKIEALKDCD